MAERRFTDEEVAEIFRRATEASTAAASALPPSEGLTLAEVQEIGREVGLAPEGLADAARSLDRLEPRFRSQLMGFTVGVGRTVALGRTVTDAEWERLVVRLRDTFDAKGTFRVDGSLRQWTNGNLQILVEPTDDGDRLRMRTVNAAARALLSGGVLAMTMTAMIAIVGSVVDPAHLNERLSTLIPLFGGGAAMFALGIRRARGWAQTRLQQMDDIASRLTGGSSR